MNELCYSRKIQTTATRSLVWKFVDVLEVRREFVFWHQLPEFLRCIEGDVSSFFDRFGSGPVSYTLGEVCCDRRSDVTLIKWCKSSNCELHSRNPARIVLWKRVRVFGCSFCKSSKWISEMGCTNSKRPLEWYLQPFLVQ